MPQNSSLSRQPQAITTYFDYQIVSPNNKTITLEDLSREIKNADVVLIGEWHTHSAIHRFETELLHTLFLQDPNLTLSMEQFSRDSQEIVNQYLAGEIGETTLISKANAWPNYESDYRPLVEFAKFNKLDLIAANAPDNLISCIAREGLDYINRLPANQRAWLAERISTKQSAYKRRFMSSMHHGDERQNNKQFAAQMAWDETMAESIVRYLDKHSDKQVMHIAGSFHVENGLGIAASILRRAPGLKVVIVTPVGVEDTLKEGGGDYRLQVISPPQQFVKNENRMAYFKSISTRNNNLQCIF
ncbi:ChaN family lipoprotein [Psychromonas sp.]|uniref:ChaN family lipoprotein n=1 Tax=Psychromonas sp. TaxID=1884585 RepID=UPI0039E622FB